MVVSIYLVIAPIQDDPQIEFFFALLFMLAGLLFYYPFVHRKFVLPGTGKGDPITMWGIANNQLALYIVGYYLS